MILDERGVSPVVGTLLLIAVAVLAAGTVAYFVLGLGTPADSPGNTLMAEDADANLNSGDNTQALITVEHQGGDSFDPSDTTITVTVGESSEIVRGFTSTGSSTFTATSANYKFTYEDLDGDNNFEVGESAVLAENGANVSKFTDVNIKIVHTPSQSVMMDATVEVK